MGRHSADPTEQEDDDGCHMKPNHVIPSGERKFVIIKLLGEGGFGAVYKVYEASDPVKHYALKVEKILQKRKHSKLKMEIAILKLVGQERSPDTSHFTAIVDRGKKDKYVFLVMELVGRSLDDLKRERPTKVFSLATALGSSLQCLEAVEDLHKHGFIHRDLKPANYACGTRHKEHIIYLLDFGISRRYLNDKDELKAPRVLVGFKGTVRFASLSCHRCQEMGPKDDCESWFYLLLDCLVTSGLPWRKCVDKAEVLKVKEACRKEKRSKLFNGLKSTENFGHILDYIDGLAYADKIDYNYIYKLLRAAATEGEVNIDDPYDWENEEGAARNKSRSRPSVSRSRSSARV